MKLWKIGRVKWNYEKHHVDLAMPVYVKKQLTKSPLKPQHCPYAPNPIKYGKDNQAPSPLDESPCLSKAQKKRIQQIVGTFLYYARAVHPTILMALSKIASLQAAPTENMMEHVKQFLDYMWTHSDAIIWYHASDMILNVHSDLSYLSASKACSRAGGYFFLGSIPQDGDPNKLNGAIHITCAILKFVAASAAKAELCSLFLNVQEAKVLQLIFTELGHQQPSTPIHIDNTTTVVIVNNTIKQQRSQVIKMRYFCLLDGKPQQYFKFYYQSSLENLCGYPSKHHTADIHHHVRPYYVHVENSPTLLPRAMKPSTCRECADILGDPYSKKSPLPSIGYFPHLADSPKLSSYQVLGQSRIQQRHTTCYNHPRIEAQ
jgi:hypothetical protein